MKEVISKVSITSIGKVVWCEMVGVKLTVEKVLVLLSDMKEMLLGRVGI